MLKVAFDHWERNNSKGKKDTESIMCMILDNFRFSNYFKVSKETPFYES